MISRTQLIAIIGGSGSGKTWLSNKLLHIFGPLACHIAQDNFYKDCSNLPEQERKKINFDHPSALDWARFETTLQDCREGRLTSIPQYDFVTHTRTGENREFRPKPLVIVDGLWLLTRANIRRFFNFCIFLRCSERIRLVRRIQRDIVERGRTRAVIIQQFKGTVSPMHRLFVEPQQRWAHLVFNRVLSEDDLVSLSHPLSILLTKHSYFHDSQNDSTESERRVTIHE
jgi:uridine kinase